VAPPPTCIALHLDSVRKSFVLPLIDARTTNFFSRFCLILDRQMRIYNMNKINELYVIDFIVYFISI
jgi:hypothetical protein